MMNGKLLIGLTYIQMTI